MRNLILIGLLMFTAQAWAEEELDFYKLLESVQEALPLLNAEGEIQQIDLAKRTMLVGGYQYFLVPATESQPLTVKLLGKDYGSLELLTTGMHVSIDYIDVNGHRIGFDIVQIEDSEPH